MAGGQEMRGTFIRYNVWKGETKKRHPAFFEVQREGSASEAAVSVCVKGGGDTVSDEYETGLPQGRRQTVCNLIH